MDINIIFNIGSGGIVDKSLTSASPGALSVEYMLRTTHLLIILFIMVEQGRALRVYKLFETSIVCLNK